MHTHARMQFMLLMMMMMVYVDSHKHKVRDVWTLGNNILSHLVDILNRYEKFYI